MAAATDIVDSSAPRRLDKMPERIYQIIGMNIVANLLTLVPKHRIVFACDSASHQIRKKPVQHCAGMLRPGQAPAAEANRWYPEISAIFLDHNIGSKL